jgi:hypothetical protein
VALFLQKPIFWNTDSYTQPSGASATSGFPKARGYGHEEWNNSPRLQWSESGQRYRVFHTEPVGAAPLEQNIGQTFVFMMSSHDRIQQLVGVAGNALGMLGDKYKNQRLAISKQLGIRELWSDAWNVPNVQSKHQNSVASFKSHWETDHHWIPNWICPEDYYLWLEQPVTLSSVTITGKARFLSMFSSYTTLDLATALQLMDAIPIAQRGEKWTTIRDAIQSAPNQVVSMEDGGNGGDPITDVLTRVHARRGQGQFRNSLMGIWDRACAVTGLDLSPALKASHVKPWAKSTAREKLDCHNGLLLAANLDALFDNGLISFEGDGTMLVSNQLSAEHRAYFGIPAKLRRAPSVNLQRYLGHHRNEEFIP